MRNLVHRQDFEGYHRDSRRHALTAWIPHGASGMKKQRKQYAPEETSLSVRRYLLEHVPIHIRAVFVMNFLWCLEHVYRMPKSQRRPGRSKSWRSQMSCLVVPMEVAKLLPE